MRLKKTEPDSCGNCIHYQKTLHSHFCKIYKKYLPIELFEDPNTIVCEDGYEDDGSRYVK